MRNITYIPLPAVGPEILPEETVPLAEFVLCLPYFLTFDLIPPLSVMNEEFWSGEDDAGMSGGCRWQPFQITEQEYSELIEALKVKGLREVSPPGWVKTKEDWFIWKHECVFGVPSEEYYLLHRETSKWSALAEEAMEKGEREKWEDYLVKASKANRTEQDFLQPYIDKYHKRKDIC